MRPRCCLTILHVSIWAVIILTSDADGEDSKCETEIKVRRLTAHQAVVGQELTINCPLTFCNSSPPTVSWYKLGKTGVRVDVSRDDHIRTVWTRTTKNEGTSSLVFKHIVSSDTGQYRCYSEGSTGHGINITVHGEVEFTTATWTTVEPENSAQLNLFCVVGIMVLVIAAVAVYVTPKPECKGDNCV